MVLHVSRFNGQLVGDVFEIRVANLVSETQRHGISPVQHIGMVRFDNLITILQRDDEEGMGFDITTETIVRLPQHDISLSRIKGQISFEATLQKQYNMKQGNFELAICSKDCE
jgi:hypothetical protein